MPDQEGRRQAREAYREWVRKQWPVNGVPEDMGYHVGAAFGAGAKWQRAQSIDERDKLTALLRRTAEALEDLDGGRECPSCCQTWPGIQGHYDGCVLNVVLADLRAAGVLEGPN